MVLLCVGTAIAGAGDSAFVTLHWNELSPYVEGRKVALVLPGGTAIEGKARKADAAGLHLQVTKTSDRKSLRKGEQVIPRESVSVLEATRYRKWGRILCTVGGAAAVGLAMAARNIDTSEGAAVILVPAVTAGGMAGAGVGGYYLGKRIDRQVTEIRIVPDGR
jgi:hypothetical protein